MTGRKDEIAGVISRSHRLEGGRTPRESGAGWLAGVGGCQAIGRRSQMMRRIAFWGDPMS
jgi:hypothetical protein